MPVLDDIVRDISFATGDIIKNTDGIEEISRTMIMSPSQWGDISFPCFACAKKIHKNPHEVAQQIADHIAEKVPCIAVARADAGYVNITLDSAFLYQAIDAALQAGQSYGAPQTEKPLTYIVEYASPNTNKPLHLGHIRNIALGQALIAFLKYCGHRAISAEIINDRGIHIMKSILAYQKWGNDETPESAHIKGDHFVGNYYVLFSHRVKDDPSLEEEAQKLLQQYEQGEQEICSLWERMNAWVIDGMKQTYKRLGVSFEEEDFESDIFEKGKQVVADGLARGVFKKRDDGAIYADLTDVGLDQKVVLRSDGTAIYITQDLALALMRTARHPDLEGVLYIVACEQEYHFKVLFELLKRLGFTWADTCVHVSYGLVNLPSGRMKSREGTVVDADDILDELARLALQEVQTRWQDIDSVELHSRSEMIAQAALRFYLLRVQPRQDMIYNPAESISFDGATGPYLQYTVARISHILAQVELKKKIDYTVLIERQEHVLALLVLQFPSLVHELHNHLLEKKYYNPSALTQYLYTLAQETNAFYQTYRVLQAETPALVQARAALLGAVKEVLDIGLALCCISTPTNM